MGLPFIKTEDVVARLKSKLDPSVEVYATGEVDFKASFGLKFPAVYILRQYFNAPTPGGSSRVIRQTYDIYLEVAIVARRYQSGVISTEQARFNLSESVMDALIGYTLPGGPDLALDLSSYTDGDPADTVNYGVLVFHTRALFDKVVT